MTYPRFSDAVRFSPCQKGVLCDSMVFTPAGSDTILKDNIILYNGITLSTLKDIFEAPALSFSFISKSSGIQLTVLYQEKNIGTLTLTFAPRTPSLSFNQNTFSIDILMSDIVSDSMW